MSPSCNHRSQLHRYLTQIQYGCLEKNCTTPTCFSCHKRKKHSPVQRPTRLTARAFAFLLASEADAYSGLCPHLPPEMVESMYPILPGESVEIGQPGGSDISGSAAANGNADPKVFTGLERLIPKELAYTSAVLPNGKPRPVRQQ